MADASSWEAFEASFRAAAEDDPGLREQLRLFAGPLPLGALGRLSHRFTAAAADRPANTALRSVRVLDVLLEHACAPGLSRALSLPASPRPRCANR